MSYADARILATLVLAALGHCVSVEARDERSATDAFGRYVTALEGSGLDKSLWTAHEADGNRKIQFNNGGYIRFVSHGSPHFKGTSARTVVVGEWVRPIECPFCHEKKA